MNNAPHPYYILSMMLHYPGESFKKTLSNDLPQLQDRYPQDAQGLSEFTQYVENEALADLQELYTKTFDIHAICNLDVGFVLFGEDYKRGEFLVHVKREHQEADNPCGSELPDHLPNLLNLLPKMKDQKLAAEMVQTFLIPAVDKMLKGFKENGNIYAQPLKAIRDILKSDYVGAAMAPQEGVVG
ncbi:MAG: nitrate reductase molybdenum cofactor assembly chaperone [bacterium]|nr:nitrate reductase molybdenum cofactor assembly chaperone [bacterium]